MMNEVIKLKV